MKNFFLIFFVCLSASVYSQSSFDAIIYNFYGKNPRQKSYIGIVKEYYRVNPFEGKFSAFVHALITDAEIKNNITHLKTDTSLFKFNGEYENFQPLNVKASKVLIKLEETPIINNNGTAVDTVYIYQVVAFLENTPTNLKLVQKQFEQTNKKLKRELTHNEHLDLKGIKNISEGLLINYFWGDLSVAPISFSWQIHNNNNIAVTMLLRFDVIRGYAFPTGAGINKSAI